MSVIHTLNRYRRHHRKHPDLPLWPRFAGEFDRCEHVESAFRLIVRISLPKNALFAARPSRDRGDLRCVLPGDIPSGDLVAFVIARPVALHDLRRRPQHSEWLR